MVGLALPKRLQPCSVVIKVVRVHQSWSSRKHVPARRETNRPQTRHANPLFFSLLRFTREIPCVCLPRTYKLHTTDRALTVLPPPSTYPSSYDYDAVFTAKVLLGVVDYSTFATA